ncbi:uncharacterized mitochondrial protein AtMg00810-like [Nicotiana tomentosiformis]|uniref:uncharacterized mitochondrial protein AtMg00810-like n=1 Tax=Nicotiana tomentosiformis TaxID=4098 RepID=UPI00388C3E5E
MTCDDLSLIEETKNKLQQSFKIKDLGELKYFLKIEFAQSKEGILMHQRKYALELISDMGLAGAKRVGSPLELSHKLTSSEFDKHIGDTSDALLGDPSVYQRLLGRLLYLTITRPDIAYAVQNLSQFMHSPKVLHMEVVVRLVRYIKSSPGMGILMSYVALNTLTAFCDADWASCRVTRRSVTGYMIKFGGSLISWKFKKQTTISRSSAEAEYRSLGSTVAELVWLAGLFRELAMDIQLPISLHCDSKSAIKIFANPVFHERTKHIDIDCHFIREKVLQGLVHVQYLPSSEQKADILTKALTIL